MSTDPQASLVEKIAQLFREFQQTLHKISRDQLEASKDVMGKIDEAHQDALRDEIRKA
jgi:hypothetical protein